MTLTTSVSTIRDHAGPLDDEAALLAALLRHTPESVTVERCATRLTAHAQAISAEAAKIMAGLAEQAERKERECAS